MASSAPSAAAARWPELASGRLEDHSLLIEEAYNQDAGVPRHALLAEHDADTERWELLFTQDWPLGSTTHQLTYTVPFSIAGDGGETGVGDVTLGYRPQLLDEESHAVTLSPRVSLVLPTGEPAEELGDDSLGVDVMLAASRDLGALTLHANVGGRILPAARTTEGPPDRRLVTRLVGGGSMIWNVATAVNLLCEVLAEREEKNTSAGVDTAMRVTINPGVRVAWDLPPGLTVVGAAGLPIGVTRDTPDLGLLLYLAVEHPITPAARAEHSW